MGAGKERKSGVVAKAGKAKAKPKKPTKPEPVKKPANRKGK